MWRPEGWKYQKATLGDWDNASDRLKWEIPHSFGWRDGYEAGADAMLEALRKDGWRPEQEYDKRFLSHRAVNDMIIVGKFQKGVWVFIPDEETDEV